MCYIKKNYFFRLLHWIILTVVFFVMLFFRNQHFFGNWVLKLENWKKNQKKTRNPGWFFFEMMEIRWKIHSGNFQSIWCGFFLFAFFRWWRTSFSFDFGFLFFFYFIFVFISFWFCLRLCGSTAPSDGCGAAAPATPRPLLPMAAAAPKTAAASLASATSVTLPSTAFDDDMYEDLCSQNNEELYEDLCSVQRRETIFQVF